MNIYIYIYIYIFHMLLLCRCHKEIFTKGYKVILYSTIGEFLRNSKGILKINK